MSFVYSGEETPYERFLAELSSHLTLSVPEKFCDYFQLTDEKKDKITSSQSPGLTFLTVLDEMGIIHQFDVSHLITPLREFQLVQAVARLEAYQSLVEESMFQETPVSTLEGNVNSYNRMHNHFYLSSTLQFTSVSDCAHGNVAWIVKLYL